MPACQMAPASVEYCQLAPASRPNTLTVPLLVMPSLLLLPVSAARAMLGAAGVLLSMVIAPSWALALVLPARSLWRTRMLPALWVPLETPKEVPVPASQLTPPLVEYCQLAPASRPVTLTVVVLVMPSLLLLPVSAARARLGAAAALVSMVTAPSWPLELVLPARSLWRTRMLPAL